MKKQPKLNVREWNENRLKLQFTDVSIPMITALRRSVMDDVPTMSIDMVQINENKTSLQDEFLAFKLGLIPLLSIDANQFVDGKVCSCTNGKCPKCSVVFSLKIKNVHYDNLTVTSQHLICTQDTTVKPLIHPTFLIVKLARNEEIDVECIAKKGTGKDHIKWNPCVTVTFDYDTKEKDNCSFFLQGTGVLPPHEIIIRGFDELKKRFLQLDRQLEGE